MALPRKPQNASAIFAGSDSSDPLQDEVAGPVKSTFTYKENPAHTTRVEIEADYVTFEYSHVAFWKAKLYRGLKMVENSQLLLAVQNSKIHDLREVVNAKEGQDLEPTDGD